MKKLGNVDYGWQNNRRYLCQHLLFEFSDCSVSYLALHKVASSQETVQQNNLRDKGRSNARSFQMHGQCVKAGLLKLYQKNHCQVMKTPQASNYTPGFAAGFAVPNWARHERICHFWHCQESSAHLKARMNSPCLLMLLPCLCSSMISLSLSRPTRGPLQPFLLGST